VCVDEVAASGGYMMAAVADTIVASDFAMLVSYAGREKKFDSWKREEERSDDGVVSVSVSVLLRITCLHQTQVICLSLSLSLSLSLLSVSFSVSFSLSLFLSLTLSVNLSLIL
jgi:hypothetical protein